jgi:hypothetical protein
MTLRALVILALLAVLTGCGTASAPSPPTGVDELVIPTPTPDPGDFVATVDNPWFPLPAGRTWTYDVLDTTGSHRLVVSVTDGPVVEGVATTARVAVEGRRTTTDWYAQDTAGNVWWFGRAGEWRAGADGAEAGLAMAASPRLGDGYRTAYDEGVIEDRATVASIDGTVTLPVGTYRDVVVIEVRSTVPTSTTHELTYARDVGLVEDDTTGGGYRAVRLSKLG